MMLGCLQNKSNVLYLLKKKSLALHVYSPNKKNDQRSICWSIIIFLNAIAFHIQSKFYMAIVQ